MTHTDRSNLQWAMRMALLEQTAVLTESKNEMQDYVKTEVTYEQMLNLVFNPNRTQAYKDATVLESTAISFINSYFRVPTSDEKFTMLESVLTEAGAMRRVGQWMGTVPKGSKDELDQLGQPITSSQVANADDANEKRKRADVVKKVQADASAKGTGVPDAKITSAGEVVGNAGKAVKMAGETASQLGQAGVGYIKAASKTTGGKIALTGAGVAGAAALYYLYKKLRAKGMDKKKAAAAVAAKAKGPAKAKWAKAAK